ncbi:hypothetical protein [Pontibacillus marinus]|uniref:hypothetical protein n=1 Tax=Pontibacillus marinus TaxID=273164 RepID=UPI00041B6538|nr:hypothetical protein [Pontibacillus marinus]
MNVWNLYSDSINAPSLNKDEIQSLIGEDSGQEINIKNVNQMSEAGEYVVVYHVKNDPCEYYRAWISLVNQKVTETIGYKCK